jgi:RNA polymerase sigma-70 factor (ECF subfamily)
MSNANRDLPLDLALSQTIAQRDEQLVSAARAGSADAFAELQNIYAPRLYNTIFRITRNHEDAEDTLQDTFLQVHLALYGFEGRCSFYTWATRIAMNSALMLLRRRHARPEVPFGLPSEAGGIFPSLDIRDSSPNPEQIYGERQQCDGILRSIESLQPKLQQAIQIRMASECSMEEIARRLGISVASVKSRLHRARRQLISQRQLTNSRETREPQSAARGKDFIPHLRTRELSRVSSHSLQ